jgi:hypothetical protein
MTNDLIVYHEARTELRAILASGAKSLKGLGLELMPIKRAMLRLDPEQADLVIDCCNLLFAAILQYERSQWTIKTATDPFQLIIARMEAGNARGVVESLHYGPTAKLLWLAMDRAPIAYYSMTEASPDLHLIARLEGKT